MTTDPRKQYRRWLNSVRWHNLRDRVLAASDGLCRDCLAEGRATAATEVHHVKPVLAARSEALRLRLMYDPANLVALCPDCHRRRHLELRSHDAAAVRARVRATLDSIAADVFGGSEGDPGAVF